MKKANMKDVAAAAGVSLATVGRVLHNNGSVSDKSRAAVEQKLDELGYVPNQMARALKSSRSGLIGSLFVHNINGLFHRINQSVIDAANMSGFSVLAMEARRGEEASVIDSFIGLQVNGIVIISDLDVDASLFKKLHRLNIPVVAVERAHYHEGTDNLLVRDFEGCYNAARHIAEQGHRHVGLLAVTYGDQKKGDSSVERLRYDGFMAGVRDFGLDANPNLVSNLKQNYDIQAGYEAMEELLALAEPPTAIFATADHLAAGAMQCLYAHGLKVMEDISVVGYDDVLSELLSPPINSVSLVYDNIGADVIELLNERMANHSKPQSIRWIETKYIDRGTVRHI